MKPSGILETVLYAEDLDVAQHFYGELLKLDQISREGNRHVFFLCGNQMLLIFNPRETEKRSSGKLPIPTHGAYGPGHVCFRASSDEIERWRQHLIDSAIEIEADFEWPPGGRSIYFRDPAGNSVEFAEPRIWKLE
ncbi:MAG TPA: VOC family protein [Hyphomicrobiales bacterium]|nr:VOC family protein [Hyphomicrobiales bacterium]